MERQISTLSTNGQLSIPSEMQTALGLRPGSQVQISLEDRHLVLQPIAGDIVDELQGMFAGGPSLEDDLYRHRDVDKW